MKLTNTDFIPGYEIKEALGLVLGNTVRAKHLGRDIMAGLKNIVGGEIQEYTDLLADARKETLNRMVNEAKKLGADAVINVRFMTTQTMGGAAELLAYGTAVKLLSFFLSYFWLFYRHYYPDSSHCKYGGGEDKDRSQVQARGYYSSRNRTCGVAQGGCAGRNSVYLSTVFFRDREANYGVGSGQYPTREESQCYPK